MEFSRHSQIKPLSQDGRHSQLTIGTLPGEKETEQIEVRLVRSEEGVRGIQLSLQSWSDGIGWYTQKTLFLKPKQAEALYGILDKSSTLKGKAILEKREVPRVMMRLNICIS